MAAKWSVIELPDGQFAVMFGERQIGSRRLRRADAEKSMGILKVRYPSEAAFLEAEAATKVTARAGHYVLLHRTGEKQYIYASSKKMARELLLRQSSRKKLPRGSTLQLVTAA